MKIARKQLGLLFLLVSACAMAQSTSGQTTKPSGDSANTDVYGVTFNKAVPGKSAEVGQRMSVADGSGPMASHFIVLRHQEGDDWDYCIITHMGAKATVDTAPTAPNPAYREMSAWHSDTFVSGPSWEEFAKKMGIGGEGSSGKNTAIYVLSTFRPAAGHRDPMLEALANGSQGSKVPTGSVIMQHLDGGPWAFLQITRYNSWQDLATDRSVPANDSWNQTREHLAWHHDTIADRISPK